jgi:hypothetical protein
MSWPHPSDDALTKWSEGTASRRAERHVEHCPLCLDRLEQMTQLAPQLRTQLEADLMPHDLLESRLWDRLEARIANREAVAVLTDLMEVGPTVTRLMLDAHVDRGDDDD